MDARKAFFICYFLLFTCVHNTHAQKLWWQTHPLRVFHPNMMEIEAKDFDVKKFIADCKELHAEAVVFSTRAIYAFYDTKINVEQKSPLMGNRDLLAEILREAEANNIKVIARLDFTNAPRKYFDQHPYWFHLDPGMKPRPSPYDHSTRFYQTNLLGGYQNEEFAIPVFNELLSNYNLKGFHLNGAGWRGTEYDESVVEKYNIPADKHQLKPWREKMFSLQLQRYRSLILEKTKEAIFMGETNSIESPGWSLSRGYNPELMAKGFTNILSTSGEPNETLLYRFRWWVSLTTDWLHSANAPGLPIINLKTHNNGSTLSMKPFHEYQFHAYQAMAHNAGIKAATMGLLQNMKDIRTGPMIKEIFQFMEQQQRYMTDVDPVAPIGLIWPSASGILESGGVKNFEDDLRDQMYGLYSVLAHKHFLFRLLNSNNISSEAISGFQTLILPSVELLDDRLTTVLIDFLEKGNRLVIVDRAVGPDNFSTFPQRLAKKLGGLWTNEVLKSKYAVPGGDLVKMANHNLGPIKFEAPFRKVIPNSQANVLLRDSPTPEGSFFPEEQISLEDGNNPILFTQRVGKGELIYFGGSLGEIIWKDDFPDLQTIFEKMICSNPDSRWLSTSAPSTVNITTFKSREGTIVHMVNGTGSIPLNRVVPLHNIKVVVRDNTGREILFCAPGKLPQRLSFNRKGGRAEFVVPRLDAYGQLIIK